MSAASTSTTCGTRGTSSRQRPGRPRVNRRTDGSRVDARGSRPPARDERARPVDRRPVERPRAAERRCPGRVGCTPMRGDEAAALPGSGWAAVSAGQRAGAGDGNRSRCGARSRPRRSPSSPQVLSWLVGHRGMTSRPAAASRACATPDLTSGWTGNGCTAWLRDGGVDPASALRLRGRVWRPDSWMRSGSSPARTTAPDKGSDLACGSCTHRPPSLPLEPCAMLHDARHSTARAGWVPSSAPRLGAGRA
jgi:hypothetical protein